MSENYIFMDIDNNVRVAVKKLREAYWSNDAERYAQQFVEAKEIIISSICHHGYTVVKEGDKEEERPHGEWKYEPTKGAFCSECGWHSIWNFNFCPECGADMREGDGNEV